MTLVFVPPLVGPIAGETNNTLTELRIDLGGPLAGGDLSYAADKALGEALKTNSSLKELNMVNCELGPEDVRGLAGGIAVHSSLTEVRWTFCCP